MQVLRAVKKEIEKEEKKTRKRKRKALFTLAGQFVGIVRIILTRPDQCRRSII